MKPTIRSGETGNIQESASGEFCFNEKDTIISETALRTIKLIESKNSNDNETMLSDTFDCFSAGYPISKNNKDKLIQFFKNEDNKALGRLILSKIGIIGTESNKPFIDSFLYDSDGKADISKFVGYVIKELENYPYTIEIDYDEISEIKNGGEINGVNNRSFKFKKYNTRGLIVTTINGETFVLPEKYEKLEYRRNGTFCGIIKEGKSYNGEYIKFEGNEFKVLGKIDNIRDMPNLSDAEGNLVYSAIGGKKGLKKFEDKKDGNRVLNEKISPEYDSITMVNGLVLANKKKEGDTIDLEIFSEEYEKIMIFQGVKDYKQVEGFDNIFRFKDENGYNYFEINNNGKVKAIPHLQNVKSLIRPSKSSEIFNRFENGKPVFVKYKGDKSCILIKDGDNILSYTFDGKHLNIHNPEIGLDKKLYSTYNINGETYIFDINEKRFYKSSKKFKASKTKNLDDIKNNLVEIPLVTFESL